MSVGNSRKLKASAGALVELALAPATAEDRVAEVCHSIELRGLAETTVGTWHERARMASQDSELTLINASCHPVLSPDDLPGSCRRARPSFRKPYSNRCRSVWPIFCLACPLNCFSYLQSDPSSLLNPPH